MKIFTKFLMLIALLFVQLGGVKAEDHYGVFPTCIDNFQYEDYSIFVGKKHVKFTWEVKNAAEAANYKIYYYIADERTLYNGTNDKGNDSWSQLRMYSYGTKYDWNSLVKRFTHIDQGPWAKDGYVYNTMLDASPSLGALDPDVLGKDASGNSKGLIATVTSMNPLLVGRSIKWDDPTTFANGKKVVNIAELKDGELDFGEIDGKSLCVFFIIKNTETGECYYGPDKQTNSETAGTRHFSYSILPWNGCWMSVNLCVPMPIKVSWSSTEDGDYTEVACGTDVKFPGNDVWVKLELDTSFPLADVSASDEIWYNCSSLLPIKTQHNNAGDDIDPYTEYYIESKKYEGPIHLERNTVLRYAIYNGNSLKYGQSTASGFDNLNKAIFNDKAAYSSFSDIISLSNPSYDIQPIYTNLRNNYMWSNTFVMGSTETIDLTFTRSIPNSTWVEYLTGRYGLGSGTYTYQTYVSDRPLLIPSSLEGIVDFFIILSDNQSQVAPVDEYSGTIADGSNDDWSVNGGGGTEPYLSRINWVPADMPVIVRYRNYSAANKFEEPAAAATNKANMEVQLTGENIGSDNERLPIYFLNKDNDNDQSAFNIDASQGWLFNFQNGYSFKTVTAGKENFLEYYKLENEYDDPVYNTTVRVLYPQKTEGGQPLYYKYDESGNISGPLYQKINDNGENLYQVVNENNEKLYFYWDDNGNIPSYQRTDENGKRLWEVLDENSLRTLYSVLNQSDGSPLYYYKDNSGNKVFHQVDTDNKPVYYVKDNNGNTLYHELNDEGNKLYYEYYTEDGSTEKKHFYRVTDESDNQLYQTVNSDGDRLYYQYDAEGNPVYQKCNANGEPLYYQRRYEGEWVKACYVTGTPPIGDPYTIDNISESTADGIISAWEAQGFTDIEKHYVEVTEEELSTGPLTPTPPTWPVPTTEETNYQITTTTPNAHPVINENGTSTVLAVTTEQSVDSYDNYFKLNSSGKRLYQKTNESGEPLYQAVDENDNPLYYAYYKDEDNNNQPFYFEQNETGDELYQKVDYEGKRLYYVVDEDGNKLYQRADEEGNPLYYVKALACTMSSERDYDWMRYSNGPNEEYGQTYWSSVYNVSAKVDGSEVGYISEDYYVAGYSFAPHPIVDCKLDKIKSAWEAQGEVTDFKAEPVMKPLNQIYTYFGPNNQQIIDGPYGTALWGAKYFYDTPSKAQSLVDREKKYFGPFYANYGYWNVILGGGETPDDYFRNPIPDFPIERVPADDEHPKCYQMTSTPNAYPVTVLENTGYRAYTTADTGVPAQSTEVNSYIVEVTTPTSVILETTDPTNYPLRTTEPNNYPDYSTIHTTAKELSYATTIVENDWPLTIISDDTRYAEYQNNGTLYELQTTEVNDYPILSSDDTGIPFLGEAGAAAYEGYTIDINEPYYLTEEDNVQYPYSVNYYIATDHPRTVNEDEFQNYTEEERAYLKAYTTTDSSYPPYCGRYGYDEDQNYVGDTDLQGNYPDTNYPVTTTETELYNYTLDPVVYNENYDYNYDDKGNETYKYRGDPLYTTDDSSGWPAYDYDQDPVTKHAWAVTTGNDFVDIGQFEDNGTTDFKANMEPQTFKVYDGTSDRVYWFPKYNVYHLSSLEHRDEGNFYNVLHCLTNEETVSEVETKYGGNVYGLSHDHTNTWVGANQDRNTYRSLYRSWKESGVEANTDIGLHLAAFSKKYSYNLTNDENAAPILDDWLIYAPMDRAVNFSEYQANDMYYDFGYFDTPTIFPFYYGFFMHDVDPSFDGENWAGSGWDARTGLACAAWKRVSNTSTNKIQPGKAFLVWNLEKSTFGQPSTDTGRDESEKMSMVTGTTLSAKSSLPWKDIDPTSITSHTTTEISNGAVYDLQGRRVADSEYAIPSNLQRGIYIVNGKKMVVK